MIFRRSHLYALTGVLCLLSAPDARAETLREAVASALSSHPGIEIAKARKEVSAEDQAEQHSNLFPEINASATGGRIFGNNSTTRGLVTSRGEAYSWLWEGSASVTQPIFDGFETFNRIDAAKAREDAAEFTLTDTKQGLALRAAQSFLNVMRAKEAHKKTTSYQDRIKDYLARINTMVDSGAADEAEAAQAKNIQSQLENSVAEMEGQIKLALADYAEATGSMPTGDLTIGMDAASLVKPRVDEAISGAQESHPLVLSAQKILEAEEQEIEAEKGILMPDLDGEISALKRDQKEEIGGEAVDERAVMRMSWNFSTGGGQMARIRKSKAERSEALARMAQTQRSIERDIRRAYAEYETATKQKELNAKRAGVTKELFETYEKQFEASKVRLLQLMQAENQVFTSELERINSDFRVMMAEYNILASSGALLSALSVEGEMVPEPVPAITPAPAAPPKDIEPITEVLPAPVSVPEALSLPKVEEVKEIVVEEEKTMLEQPSAPIMRKGFSDERALPVIHPDKG